MAMQHSATKSQGRTSPIVRAAAFEVATPTHAEPEPSAAAAPDHVHMLHDVLTALKRQIDELRSRRRQSLTDIAALSIELGVALTERMLHAEISANRQRLDRIVLQALDRLPVGSKATVRGHPDDLALLKQQLASPDDAAKTDALAPKVDLGNDVTLQPDPTLGRGNIKLEADDFFVSWDTATCLKEFRAALLEETFKDA